MLTPSSTSAFLLLLSSLISGFLLVIVWRRRKVAPGSIALLVFLIGTFTWSFTYAIHWLQNTPDAKRLWLDLSYIGVVISPTAWFIFVFHFLGRAQWLHGWRLQMLFIEPTLTLFLLLTDPLHNLFFGGLRDPMQSQIYNGGICFWFNVIYTYILLLMTILVILGAFFRHTQLYRQQSHLLLGGVFFPVMSNIFTFSGLSPIPGLDLTPIAFTITGTFLTYGLLSRRIFDLVPIGREVLVEKMREGMLLLDARQRLIDINPAARRLFNLPEKNLLGEPVCGVLKDHPDLLNLLSQDNQTEMVLHTPAGQYLEILAQPVSESNIALSGTLIICRDISTQKNAEQNLRHQYEQITSLEATLREQALRDPLTGVFNRRYLQETLPRELAQTEREQGTLALVMLDLDNFKKLNDTYGHLAGDKVLCRLGKLLMDHTRRGDMIVRYGGEEFLWVMLNTTQSSAIERTEQLRQNFVREPFYADAPPEMRCTFSAGIAIYPLHASTDEELIRQSDTALYLAKAAGKNCIRVVS